MREPGANARGWTFRLPPLFFAGPYGLVLHGKEKRNMNIKTVLEPFIDDNGIRDGINAIGFFPAERVNEIFSRMEAAWDTDNEVAELRIFYQRMRRAKERFSYPSQTWLDVDGIEEGLEMRWVTLGEAIEDAEHVRSITGYQT
jgi:hypothetical protein